MYMHVNKEMLCCKFLIFNNCNFICLFSCFSTLHQHYKHLYLQKVPFFFLRSESNLHFPHPAFGRSGCRLSKPTVIFLTNVSDVWRWPNPVKTLIVPFLLQNRQWNQRMNCHEPCKQLKVKYSLSLS